MEIYGMQKDMEAFGRLLPERQERIARASAEPVRDDPINALARRLHPGWFDLVIAEIRDETATTRTFRLQAGARHGASRLPGRPVPEPQGADRGFLAHAALLHRLGPA